MGFFDDLKEAAGSMAKEVSTMGNTVAIKAKEKSSVFKLKKQIEDIEIEISKTYKEVGLKVVEDYKGINPMEEDTLVSLIKKIDDAKEKIKEIEAEIEIVSVNADENITEMKEKNKI